VNVTRNVSWLIPGVLLYAAVLVPEERVAGALVLSDLLVAGSLVLNVLYFGGARNVPIRFLKPALTVFLIEFLLQLYVLVVSIFWREVSIQGFTKLSGQYIRIAIYVIALQIGYKQLEKVRSVTYLNVFLLCSILLIDYVQLRFQVIPNQYCIAYYDRSGISEVEMPRYAVYNDHLGFFIVLFYLFYNISRRRNVSVFGLSAVGFTFFSLTSDFMHSTTGILILMSSGIQTIRVFLSRFGLKIMLLLMIIFGVFLPTLVDRLNSVGFGHDSLEMGIQDDVLVRSVVWDNWLAPYGRSFLGIGVDQYFKIKEEAVDNISRAVDSILLDAFLRAGIPLLIFRVAYLAAIAYFIISVSKKDYFVRSSGLMILAINFYNLVFPVPSTMLITFIFMLDQYSDLEEN
jgi:hypothetical protein